MATAKEQMQILGLNPGEYSAIRLDVLDFLDKASGSKQATSELSASLLTSHLADFVESQRGGYFFRQQMVTTGENAGVPGVAWLHGVDRQTILKGLPRIAIRWIKRRRPDKAPETDSVEPEERQTRRSTVNVEGEIGEIAVAPTVELEGPIEGAVATQWSESDRRGDSRGTTLGPESPELTEGLDDPPEPFPSGTKRKYQEDSTEEQEEQTGGQTDDDVDSGAENSDAEAFVNPPSSTNKRIRRTERMTSRYTEHRWPGTSTTPRVEPLTVLANVPSGHRSPSLPQPVETANATRRTHDEASRRFGFSTPSHRQSQAHNDAAVDLLINHVRRMIFKRINVAEGKIIAAGNDLEKLRVHDAVMEAFKGFNDEFQVIVNAMRRQPDW
ncbi:hypothetical protein LTR05_001589 [Lithohypha guttulata]|uniref:Uncharacterized protein n=1 Tax=Lithohypha guttulata TaxID=1690604 RepID=A0AAN7TIP0_9EURO|nr:hypothetical protein LTR05_001589 [Lithohypha guttulata]